MAYIPYPQAPTGPNGYQILGQGLLQFGQGLTEEEDRQAKLREAMENMTQRRAAALLAKQESELRQKALEQETKQKSDAEQRAHDFALAAAQGKVISPTLAQDPSLGQPTRRPAAAPTMRGSAPAAPGELPAQGVTGDDATAMMGRAVDRYLEGNPADTGAEPYGREELARKALEMRQLTPEQYLTATKPERGRYSVQEIGGRKVRVNMDTGEQEDLGAARPQRDRQTINEINGRKVRVNLDTGEMQDLGPVTQKPGNAKAKQTVKAKIASLEIAKSQLQDMRNKWDAIKDSYAAGRFNPTFVPSEAGEAFDAAVDAFRQTGTTLTRVPGVGAMSDFETKLTQAPIPKRKGEYESVTEQKIAQWESLVDILDKGYRDMQAEMDDNEASPESEAPAPAPTRSAGPSLPARGRFKAVDAKTAGEYLKRAGGDRKEARRLLAKDGYNVGN